MESKRINIKKKMTKCQDQSFIPHEIKKKNERNQI